MTGFGGGIVDESELDSMIDAMMYESWYDRETFGSDGCGLGLVHHGERDPAGHTTWQDGHRAGVIHGVVSNGGGEELDTEELFEAVLDDPEAVLAGIDGPFAIACYDAEADRIVVATDKIGARPCFYAVPEEEAESGLLFGSSVKAPLAEIEAATVDEQAVSDLIMLGHVWGQKTLAEEVRALSPATVLEYDAGDVSRTRYWQPTFEEADAGDEYVFELASRYRSAVEDMAGTIEGETGLWLSGGLDSRSMASELKRTVGSDEGVDGIRTYTYDSNPPAGGNPALARRIARTLDLGNRTVDLNGERFAEIVADAIDVTDGLVRWNSFVNISAVYNLGDDPGVVLEAAGQGELLGEHIMRYHLTECEDAADGLYQRQAALPAGTIEEVMAVDVDPRETFERSVERSDETTMRKRVLDAHFRNHYARFVFSSNPVGRSQAGTRTPFANGAFIDHVASLPLTYRMGSVPFTEGGVPYGASKSKLRLIRALNADLAAIPYERTRLPPKYPYPAHVAGFGLNTAVGLLRDEMTHGGTTLADAWYRNDPDLREYVDDLLEGACDRDLFDAEAIRELRREHLSGEADTIMTLAPISTVEAWMRNYID